ncbi:MAG: hypothetical protein ACYSTY_06860, partial [Planctomycetota bacterium]
MLDDERGRVSPDLPTAAARVREQRDDFTRLLCRLRGRVTLSFASREIEEDSETFASPVVLSAYRILSGQNDADHSDLVRWLDPAASFAPPALESCLDAGEWWLCQGSRDEPVSNLGEVAEVACANLGRGREAREARASEEFTVFDGRIEEPGAELDPPLPQGPVLSATGRLGTLGRCPLAYFYR